MREKLKMHKRKIILLLLVAGLLVYLYFPASARVDPAPSLFPESKRMVGLRFDPSFFYDRGLTARELAQQQVKRWAESGINTVFFRVYDPAYGAGYKTSFRYNKETDYGNQDLLGYVLKEAEEYGLQVYAWLTPLNHREVWEAKPAWRSLRSNGDPYKTESVPYPLCARHPGVQQWWLGFVRDLLDRYPALAGIDVAEPVVSWREGEACFCPVCRNGFTSGNGKTDEEWNKYRSEALTSLMLRTFQLAEEDKKKTILTTVLPTDPEGNVFPFSVLRDRTGLDLEMVLSSPLRPDDISFEFMWQEWAVIYKDPALFTPAWVKRAFSHASKLVQGRTGIIAHLELSDFQERTVGGRDLSESLAAAIEAGAEGIEIYEASLIEKKNAWASLEGLRASRPVKKILLLHDLEGRPDARKLATLCGHFSTDVTIKEVISYQAGEIEEYNALCYLNVNKGVLPGDALLADVAAAHIPVLWLNNHIDKLLARTPRYGFTYLDHKKDGSFNRVVYKNTELVRGEPELNVVQISQPEKAEVIAQVVSSEVSLPYVIHAAHLWYFADNPFSFAVEGGNYLVLADLLHDILGEDHKEKQLALVRLEDVHPLTPPDKLRKAAKLLSSRNVPFLVSIVPFYVYPEKGIFISLSDRPEFVDAIKFMERMGGTVVLHGITHQRTGETTADYEFWDPVANTPLEDRTDANIKARIMRGLKECLKNGIHPLLWETPHYAASLADYRVVSEIFSTACERRQADNIVGTDQLYPYMIQKDLFGQMLLPENLGYVPLDDQRAEPILTAARRSKVVRDVTVGFFFHLFCDMGVLEEIVEGLSDQQFRFLDVRSLPLTVEGPDFHLSTVKALFPDNRTFPEALLLDKDREIVWQGESSDYPHGKEPEKGIRFFPGEWEKKQEVDEQVVLHLSGSDGFLVRPLEVGIVASVDAFDRLAAPFRAVAAPCTRFDPEADVTTFPEQLSLLVVPPEVAEKISISLRPQIMNFTARGGTLLTWGASPLVESAGVAFTGEERTVKTVVDLNYGTVAELSKSLSVPTVTCEGPSEVVAQDQATETPVLYVVDVNDGRLLYSALPPFAGPADSPYPYFMSMLRSHCMLAPLLRSKRLEVYFDPGLRENVAVEDLVKLWARNGVRIIHAGAWHEYPEWTYEYDRLIELAHQNGMLVYAWLVLPFVSPKFHAEHPEWHEKSPLGGKVGVDWRQAAALTDPECMKAVTRCLADFFTRYPFDGVNLAGLHFWSEGPDKPETISPFNETACRRFSDQFGYDPRTIWDETSQKFWKRSPESLKQFNEWRAALTTELHRRFLDFFRKLEGGSELAVVVAMLDSKALPGKNELLGVDTVELLKLRKEHPFTVQLMDPGNKRPLGKERMASLIRDYGAWISPSEMTLHLDLSKKIAGFSVKRLSGLPLYQQLAAATPVAVAVYSEESVPDADWPYLSRALASCASVAMKGSSLSIQSPISVRLGLNVQQHLRPFSQEKQWPAWDPNEVLIPPGDHTFTFRSGSWSSDDETNLVDLSCDLLSTVTVTRGLQFSYTSTHGVCAVINKEPVSVSVDGRGYRVAPKQGLRGYAFQLPAGKHVVNVTTESWSSFALRMGSVILSSGIVGISIISLTLVAILFVLGRFRARAVNAKAIKTQKAES